MRVYHLQQCITIFSFVKEEIGPGIIMCDHQFSWISDLSFFPSNGVQKYGDTVFLKVLLVAADIVKTFEDDNVR